MESRTESPPIEAPTASELLQHPAVRRALEEAWKHSQPEEPDQRHEEGGWIYMDTTTGEIATRRAPSGRQTAINLNWPPTLPGHVVVGKFHTPPNPSAEGWVTGPSSSDRAIDARHGVPDLILADDGIHVSGPEVRRGGTRGGPGFPPLAEEA